MRGQSAGNPPRSRSRDWMLSDVYSPALDLLSARSWDSSSLFADANTGDGSVSDFGGGGDLSSGAADLGGGESSGAGASSDY